MRRLVVIAIVFGMVSSATAAFAASPHFVGAVICSTEDSQLCCTGKVAGLGNVVTQVEVLATFNCTNRGGNNPPGLARGISEPIEPRNGQITFDVCTEGRHCPSAQMTPSFSNATVNVYQGGTLILSSDSE